MAFPVGPTNGQITTVNGIKYVYRSATNSWARLGSAKFTAAASAPSNAAQGDRWYNTSLDILFEFINDGTSNYWVDIQSVGQTGNVTSISDSVLNGNIVVGVNSRYSIGSSVGYLQNIYANNITANSTVSNTIVANSVVSNSIVTTTAVRWSGNGNPITGTPYTVSATPPSGPSLGDQWYNTINDVLYEYISDGTSSYWVDIQSSVLSSNTNIITTANEFYSYANTKIGTNTNSNLVVDATTTSISTTTGALVVKGGAGIAGNITVGGNLVANGYSNVFIASGTLLNRSALTIAGNINGRGGVGYLDALTLTNTFSSATNPNKWIRVNSAGGLEIVNSSYNSLIMTLSDSGNLSVSGLYQVNGNQAVNGPAFSAVLLTGQVVASGSLANVVYNGEYYDTNNCYNTSTGIFTPNVAGYYQFNWTAGSNTYAASTGIVTSTLYKNNNELARGFRGVCNTAGVVAPGSASCYLNGTTDYVQIRFLQGSGSNATLEADAGAQAAGYSYANYFNGVMVRGA